MNISYEQISLPMRRDRAPACYPLFLSLSLQNDIFEPNGLFFLNYRSALLGKLPYTQILNTIYTLSLFPASCYRPPTLFSLVSAFSLASQTIFYYEPNGVFFPNETTAIRGCFQKVSPGKQSRQ